MLSSETLVTTSPGKRLHRGFFESEPKWRLVEEDAVVTLAEGPVGMQKPEIRLLDRAYNVWGSLHDYDTVISVEQPLAMFFKPLDIACLRQPRIPTRYSEAARELRDLLPSVGLETLAKMCGVSDTGYRNWTRGKGIREKQLRRLLAVRSLVRAVVIQRGATAASDWMQQPHPLLDGESPIDAISHDRLDDVLPLALEWRSPTRRSLIPEVEEGDLLDAQEMSAVQQLAPVEVFTNF